MIRFSILFLLIAIAMSSCGPKTIYADVQELDEAFWGYNDTLTFEFKIEDTLGFYDIVLEVDHFREFDWANLYTYVETTFPNDTVVGQVLSLELSDKLGQWLGDCDASDCEVDILLSSNKKFKHKGQHRISIVQESRSASILGVSKVGLRVVESDQ